MDIQAEINAAAPGSTVVVPAGPYSVDAARASIRPKSNMTLQVDGDLQATPAELRWTAVVLLENVSDVTVVLNGSITGDHYTHVNSTDDSGFGVAVLGSTNISIKGPGTIKNCAGDGLYVDRGSRNVTISQLTSTNNRRQAMSVIDVDGLDADGVSFLNSAGAPPSAGVDLEPDEPTKSIRNVRMRNCKMLGNAGASVLIACPKSARSNIDIDGSNQMDRHPIDGTDGVVAWYAKLWFYIFRSYWLYPRRVSL